MDAVRSWGHHYPYAYTGVRIAAGSCCLIAAAATRIRGG